MSNFIICCGILMSIFGIVVIVFTGLSLTDDDKPITKKQVFNMIFGVTFFLCGLVSVMFTPGEKYTVTVITELGTDVYNNGTLILHDEFIEINQDGQKILYFNPKKVIRVKQSN